MRTAMFQFRSEGEPSLAEVCEKYGLDRSEVDESFGVVGTDDRDGLYVVLIDDEAELKVSRRLAELGLSGDPAVGVFSNPPVEGFEEG